MVNACKKKFTQPINLRWSDGCAADPHSGISPPKADGEPLKAVGSGVR